MRSNTNISLPDIHSLCINVGAGKKKPAEALRKATKQLQDVVKHIRRKKHALVKEGKNALSSPEFDELNSQEYTIQLALDVLSTAASFAKHTKSSFFKDRIDGEKAIQDIRAAIIQHMYAVQSAQSIEEDKRGEFLTVAKSILQLTQQCMQHSVDRLCHKKHSKENDKIVNGIAETFRKEIADKTPYTRVVSQEDYSRSGTDTSYSGISSQAYFSKSSQTEYSDKTSTQQQTTPLISLSSPDARFVNQLGEGQYGTCSLVEITNLEKRRAFQESHLIAQGQSSIVLKTLKNTNEANHQTILEQTITEGMIGRIYRLHYEEMVERDPTYERYVNLVDVINYNGIPAIVSSQETYSSAQHFNWISKRGPAETGEIYARFCRQLAHGLYTLTHLRIAHTDIWSDNIFVYEDPKTGLTYPRIGDFGLSHVVESPDGVDYLPDDTRQRQPRRMPYDFLALRAVCSELFNHFQGGIVMLEWGVKSIPGANSICLQTTEPATPSAITRMKLAQEAKNSGVPIVDIGQESDRRELGRIHDIAKKIVAPNEYILKWVNSPLFLEYVYHTYSAANGVSREAYQKKSLELIDAAYDHYMETVIRRQSPISTQSAQQMTPPQQAASTDTDIAAAIKTAKRANYASGKIPSPDSTPLATARPLPIPTSTRTNAERPLPPLPVSPNVNTQRRGGRPLPAAPQQPPAQWIPNTPQPLRRPAPPPRPAQRPPVTQQQTPVVPLKPTQPMRRGQLPFQPTQPSVALPPRSVPAVGPGNHPATMFGSTVPTQQATGKVVVSELRTRFENRHK